MQRRGQRQCQADEAQRGEEEKGMDSKQRLWHSPSAARPRCNFPARSRAPARPTESSLPSESGLYERLRRLYGVSKPPDHYHTGWEVEAQLERSGFRRRERWFVPLRVRVAPLYLVSAWSAD